MRILPISAILLAASGSMPAATTAAQDYGVPSARERFEIKKAIVKEKLDSVLLPAMRKHGIDMWLVMDRENHREPMNAELGGPHSGVRAAFIFFDNGGPKPEKIFINSHAQSENSVITQVYDVKRYYGYDKAGITPILKEIIFARKPKKIGINTSYTLPDADGLTAGLRDYLVEVLGPEYAKKLVSAELVVRDYRTTRTPLETKLYTTLLEWSSRWQSEALMQIKPGKTTSEDVAWWLEDKARELGMTGGGGVRVVRRGDLLRTNADDVVIQPGDIISIDGGLNYEGYATDIKRACYILQDGETALPPNLQKAWDATLKWADRYAAAMVPGQIGTEIWKGLMKQATREGYAVAYPDSGGNAASDFKPEVGIYGHSTGSVAHDIGARIADDFPFAYGERVHFPVRLNEYVSLEFHVSTPIPEWGGKTWYARFEENAQVGAHGIIWLIPRQEKILLVPTHGVQN
jgi:Xaa-Pro aminopeptidase